MSYSLLKGGLLLALLSFSLSCFAADTKDAPKAKAKPNAKEKPKEKPPEFPYPSRVANDPDFAIQGEYEGKGLLAGQDGAVGGQVIALGKGEFTVVLHQGGLPGEGWKKGDKRCFLNGKTASPGCVTLKGEKDDAALAGTLGGDKLTVSDADGKTKVELARVERHSPTLGAKPPAGATVLFDGSNLDRFPGAKMSEDPAEKSMFSDATSVALPADYHLHLEFRLTYMPTARGQARSNSGVYLHESYEVQVLDSFGLEGANNECGGFYKIKEPSVNMCLPPLAWQTYDVDFQAPRYDGTKKVSNAKVTVQHNGVMIHDNVELPNDTPGKKKEGPAPRGVYLQGHGCHVQYRNIWVQGK